MIPPVPLRLSTLALLVSLLMGILPPVLFFALEYRYQRGEITSAAEINARLGTELINKNPELWQFEQPRLEELLGNRSRNGAAHLAEIREILSISGASIARSADPVLAPVIVASSTLFNAGRPVGIILITRSLRPIVLDSLLVALVSVALASALYYKVMAVPLRALRQAFADLDEERERALITLRSIGDAVVTTDAQMRVQYLNPIAERLMGWTCEQARGESMESVFRIVHEDTRSAAVNPIRECLLSNSIVEVGNRSILIRKTDAQEFYIEHCAAPIRRTTGEIIGAVMVFHDVSEGRAAQNQLLYNAQHDALTGLPNRVLFHRNLESEIDGALASGTKFAVLFLDLDRFKLINDTLGHHVGDQLLVMVGKRLCKTVRDTDTIARMGGDEFTAILPGIDAHDDAQRIANDILAAVGRPFTIAGHEICVTTSIGIAFYPDDGANADELVKNADVAMYQAKDGGRNASRSYVDGGTEPVLARLQFESQLRTALEREEFFLEYQPKLDLATRRVVGMEALIRWRNGARGIVPPDHFIALLEESEQIVAVGEWVLRTALAQAAKWAEDGFPISIAVNFSARQFQDASFVAMLEAALAAAKFPVELFEIEVTESLLIQNERHQAILGYLKSTGMHIALDDFGTGYSSLSYLRNFPIDVLKIDKSFIRELTFDAPSLKIVKTIVDLGHALTMSVVAEGVETAEQCDLLRQIGCNVIQGNWLSRPMGSAATLGWLRAYEAAQLEPVALAFA
jgi:diguanylate cyclase (GGDEF)-like protein/PAS domain S-box-containing protein